MFNLAAHYRLRIAKWLPTFFSSIDKAAAFINEEFFIAGVCYV